MAKDFESLYWEHFGRLYQAEDLVESVISEDDDDLIITTLDDDELEGE